MKESKLIILLFLFLIISCHHPNGNEDVVYLDPLERTLSPDSLFSGMNLIYLEESDDFLIGEINKIIRNSSTYYILDSDKSKAIFAYDTLGNYISKYAGMGGGPGEYRSISDFDIDTVRNQITILCNSSKLIVTDLQLSLIKEISLHDNYYDRIAIIDDYIYLYSYYNEVIGKYDTNGKLLDKKSIPNKLMNGNVFFPQSVFYKLSDQCLMQSPGDDVIYIEDNGEWKEHLKLDYKKKDASTKLYSKNNVDEISFEDKVSHPLPYIRCLFEFKSKISIIYLFGILHYIHDGNKVFIFSELPGVSSLNYTNGHLCTWEYTSGFDLEDFLNNKKIRKIENFQVRILRDKQNNELDDSILLIDYIIKK